MKSLKLKVSAVLTFLLLGFGIDSASASQELKQNSATTNGIEIMQASAENNSAIKGKKKKKKRRHHGERCAAFGG